MECREREYPKHIPRNYFKICLLSKYSGTSRGIKDEDDVFLLFAGGQDGKRVKITL
jgi:hypothetical protein